MPYATPHHHHQGHWDVLAQRSSHQAQTFQGQPTTASSPPKQLCFYGGYGNCGESCLCGQSPPSPSIALCSYSLCWNFSANLMIKNLYKSLIWAQNDFPPSVPLPLSLPPRFSLTFPLHFSAWTDLLAMFYYFCFILNKADASPSSLNRVPEGSNMTQSHYCMSTAVTKEE